MREILNSKLEDTRCFIDDENIITVVFNGQVTVENDKLLNTAINEAIKIIRSEHRPALYLADIRKMGTLPTEVRKTAFKSILSLDLDKRAYVMNQSGLVTNMMNLVLGLFNQSKPGQFRLFKDEASAYGWLRTFLNA